MASETSSCLKWKTFQLRIPELTPWTATYRARVVSSYVKTCFWLICSCQRVNRHHSICMICTMWPIGLAISGHSLKLSIICRYTVSQSHLRHKTLWKTALIITNLHLASWCRRFSVSIKLTDILPVTMVVPFGQCIESENTLKIHTFERQHQLWSGHRRASTERIHYQKLAENKNP